MTDTGVDGSASGPPEPARSRSVALVSVGVLAALALVAGFVIWTSGGNDEATSPTTASLVSGSTLPTASSTAPASTVPPVEPSTTTAVAVATTPATAAPTTAAPPGFELPDPGAPTWTVSLVTGDAISLALATSDGDVSVYDGVADPLRCAGVVGPGAAVTTWCGEPGVATSFVADRGLEPIVVELGADTGRAVVRRQTTGWTLASNGCAPPMVTLLGAIDPGSRPVTSVVCAGTEAFVGIGGSLFGPDPAPDGGGFLLGRGDEGWDVVDFGTSIACDGPDGVDRCESFRVETELFEALLPIPSPDVLGATTVDVVDVVDRTADVEAWIEGATDPAEIDSIVVAQLVDPDAEVPATVRRADLPGFDRVRLLVVEIPQLDDAVRSETWAVWIGAPGGPDGVRASSWVTCARGVTGDGLCV